MADAAIFIDGKVRQTTNLTGVTFNSKTGFVANFTFNQIRYVHVYKDKFNNRDANSKNASAGYYNESQFLKYLVNDGVSINDLPAAKLNLDTITSAKLKDTVRVQFFRVKSPYTDFCTVDKYSWDFDPNAKVLDDTHFDIILQPGYTVVQEKITLSAVSDDFYAKTSHWLLVQILQRIKIPARIIYR
ncbi:hypothetical protein [Mucilaginibacter sp. L3T2-6]|uniref:hypothetical protein n=1 Tax=Mucilaginibacter sp. L3T2-6 TaxID=3062491 RepID=UPI0026750453|nr:hypothetical protein [Mucilaginibacter sp. L3T2-6]MDO3641333.1 hypothetical protein [Mucilaginibacter sp. L3T2-6]MDV6213906.1 hypothetical protein [Mucilaginibacter sp. L3T2-6]